MLFSEYNFFKINLIEPASPLMYGIIELHDHIFFFLNMILFLVLFLLATTIRYFTYVKNSRVNRYLLSQTASTRFSWLRLNHGTNLEIIWTVLPSIVLVLIAIPSFALLYATDELIDPSVTIQVVAHQWYWSYEYNDLVVADHSTMILTRHEKEAIEVTNFLWTISLTQNLALVTNESDREVFALMLAGPHAQTPAVDYWHLSPYMWEAYARNGIDVIGLKEAMREIYPWYNTYINTIDIPFARMSEWSKWVGVWWRPSTIVGNIEFDSYLKQESDLNFGERRLYETDFPLVLPKQTHIRFMITSEDVIHSWSVPALGIKVDAVPGRINHAHTYIKRSGTFFGQCSELCGVNHGFMPIQIIVFEPHMYYNYLRLMLLSK